ncbi:MAG: hypothetical protein AAF628_04335 [Planctomycetota bacterium]
MRAARLLAALPAALLASALLVWIWTWASAAPEPSSWRVVWREPPLVFSWSTFFDFSDRDNHVGFRLLRLVLLALPGVDFDRQALLSWVLAVGCVVAVGREARRLVSGAGVAGRIAFCSVLTLAAALLLSPGFGATWLLAERVRLMVPAAALFAVLAVLRQRRAWPLRFAIAAALTWFAVVTAPAGAAIWLAALPMVTAMAAAAGDRRRTLAWVAAWCLLGNLGPALCYDEPHLGLGLGAALREAPLRLCTLLASVAGRSLPELLEDVAVDRWCVGAVLWLALAGLATAVVRRRDAASRQALPWLCMALFGAIEVVVIAHFSWDLSDADPLLMERCYGISLLPIGLAGGVWALMPPAVLAARWWRGAAVGVAVALGVLSVLDWRRGLDRLRVEGALLRQGEAVAVFVEADPPVVGPAVAPLAPLPLAPLRAALRATGRMRHTTPVGSLALAALVEGPAARGAFLQATAQLAVGAVATNVGGRCADAILVVRERDHDRAEIVQVSVPDVLKRTPVVSWAAPLDTVSPLVEGDVVRAYAFDVRQRVVGRLPGAFRYTGGAFVSVPEAGG